LLPKSGWQELRPLLKASSIVGVVAGGIGSWKTLSLVVPALIYGSSSPFFLYGIVPIIALLLLGGPAALISSLCLVFLRLTDDQNNILGFVSAMGSFSILVVLPYFFLVSS
jgi:hypothetical protein